MRILPGFLILATLASAADLPAGAGWPQWRGPNRDGVAAETNLAATWPETGPKLVWKITGLGAGYSGVAIADGKLFTVGGESLLAYDLATQKQLWAVKIGAAWKDKTYPGPRSTPTVDGGMVYVLGPYGDLVAVDLAGKEAWRKEFAKDFEGQMATQWGYSESVLVDGDKLICTPGGPSAMMVALDKKTGKVIWKCTAPDIGGKGKDGASYSSPVAVAGQYVTLTGKGAIGVAAKDGKFLWGYNKLGNTMALTMTPVVKGDLVLVSAAYGGGTALLKLTGEKMEEVWYVEPKVFQNDSGGAVLAGDHVYGAHGTGPVKLTCLEWGTGKVVWQSPSVPGKNLSVTLADGKLFCRSGNGPVLLVNAAPDAYKELAKFTPEGATDQGWTPAVIVGGKLYLRDQDTLFCYDVAGK
jgi:outer membrane protein assembly factor BamB